jgi:hypothetical protein
MNRLVRGVCLAVVLAASAATGAAAQAAPHPNVISVNPFGILLDFFNAEYERAIAPTQTVGVGGSTYASDYEEWTGGDSYVTRRARYLNADAFWRYYPSGRPFEGWNLGVKAGITSITSDHPGEEGGTHFGYGFDANRSWLLGPTDRLYVSVGFGLKRLIGVEDDFLKYVPTFRIVNVGFAF